MIPLVNDEIYHIVNRSISSQHIFPCKRDNQHFLDTISYYRHPASALKLSKYLALSRNLRAEVVKNHEDDIVGIICYCLMPNHFHLLVKQNKGGGISRFMSNLTNSYTRYFNTKYERKGPIFEGRFRAVRIETNEQLLHVSRYIHLNPFSSYVVKKVEDLAVYPFCSFSEYLEDTVDGFCDKDLILNQFSKRSDYRKFINNHADYQRGLELIKHLILDQ